MFKRFRDTNYFVSEQGIVYNEKTKNYLAGSKDKDGYLRIQVKKKNLSIHRMVLETFLPKEGMEELEVNHIDGNKLNNSLDNLEWVTHQENMAHAVKTHLSDKCSNAGEKNGRAKLTEEKVKEIRKDKRSLAQIASDYGVTKSTISAIKNYKLWSNIE